MSDDRTAVNYVIATPKSWYSELPRRLEQALPGSFVLIDREADLTLERIEPLAPRYVFFPHWSSRIPGEIFDRFECVIFHMTDVPFGRGGSPLQNLIARGIHETKVSAIRCSAELDGGPVYMKCPLSLYGSAEEIYLRAAGVVERMIIDIVRAEPVPHEQVGEATYFRRRTPVESDIAELDELEKVFDHIRMLDAVGYPHAFLETKGLRIEFRRASLRQDSIHADVVIRKKTRE